MLWGDELMAENVCSAKKAMKNARRPYQLIFFILPGLCIHVLGASALAAILLNFVAGMGIYLIDVWGQP